MHLFEVQPPHSMLHTGFFAQQLGFYRRPRREAIPANHSVPQTNIVRECTAIPKKQNSPTKRIGKAIIALNY